MAEDRVTHWAGTAPPAIDANHVLMQRRRSWGRKPSTPPLRLCGPPPSTSATGAPLSAPRVRKTYLRVLPSLQQFRPLASSGTAQSTPLLLPLRFAGRSSPLVQVDLVPRRPHRQPHATPGVEASRLARPLRTVLAARALSPPAARRVGPAAAPLALVHDPRATGRWRRGSSAHRPVNTRRTAAHRAVRREPFPPRGSRVTDPSKSARVPRARSRVGLRARRLARRGAPAAGPTDSSVDGRPCPGVRPGSLERGRRTVPASRARRLSALGSRPVAIRCSAFLASPARRQGRRRRAATTQP